MRLLLVDDHEVVRRGLAFMINDQPDMEVVGEAASGAEAVELFRKQTPDLVLMDLRLPDMTGIECAAELRGIAEEARIVILTTFSGNEHIYRAMKAGVRAYLFKDMAGDVIMGALRTVHAGGTFLPPPIATSLAQRLTEAELSQREIAILKALAKGASNKDIGRQLDIAESTVKGHMNHLLSKLRARDRTEAVTIALRRGLITLD
ncbi:MAG TPA: response regulator transcription factor [Chthoniobacteraceae bacterium]|nr:response regulator transcription factor [Chthoniobacteraceae bacterium]